MLDNLVTWIINNGGLYILLLVVFAETGLFVGFFLPGDSLLFLAGIYAHELDANTHTPGLSYEFLNLIGLGSVRNEWLDLAVLIGLISFAGIIGNTVGYWFGRKIGPSMYSWKDRLLFKQKYLHQAKEFYEKHGGIAIIGARFLPLVRTFAPIIAGIVAMDKKKFAFFNIVGSFAWVSSMVLGGHFLQKWVLSQFGFDLKSHLEVIVIVIVLVTTAPVAYKMFFSPKKSATLEIAKEIPGEVLDSDTPEDDNDNSRPKSRS
jgi:membrane-associated protein